MRSDRLKNRTGRMESGVKISVVTVCLNAAATIAETMESVLCQTYADWEYIIMDGQSVDGTLAVIREMIGAYESRETAGQQKVQVFSARDGGLYQAMNKAVDVCSGEYVLFLNSGDRFVSEKVLAEAAQKITEISTGKSGNARRSGPVELAYGNVVRVYDNGVILEKYPGKHTVFKLLMIGKMPCHQSIFTRTDIMRKYRFDESYRICADFDFLMRCHKGKVRMHYIDTDVSKVDCVDGISSQRANLDKMRTEDDRSIRENYPGMYYLMRPVKWMVRRAGER